MPIVKRQTSAWSWRQISPLWWWIFLPALLLRAVYFFTVPPNLDAYQMLRAALMAPLGTPPWFSGWPGVPQHLATTLSSYAVIAVKTVAQAMQQQESGSWIELFSQQVAYAYQDLTTYYRWTAIYLLPLSLLQFYFIAGIVRLLKLSTPWRYLTAIITVFLPLHMTIGSVNQRPDLWLMTGILGSFYYWLRWQQQQERWWLGCSFAMALMALSAKHSALIWWVTLLVTALVTMPRTQRRSYIKWLIGINLLGLLLWNPYWLTQPLSMLKGVAVVTAIVGGKIPMASDFHGNIIALLFEQYPLLLLFLILGWGWRWRHGHSDKQYSQIEWMLWVPIVIHLMVLMGSGYYETHYFLPVTILLPFAAAVCFEQCRWPRRWVNMGCVMLLLALGWQLVRNHQAVIRFAPTAGERCLQWVMNHIPTDKRIVYDFGDLWLPQNRASYQFIIDEVLDRTVKRRYAEGRSEYFQSVYNQEEAIELFEARLVLQYPRFEGVNYFTYPMMRRLKNPQFLETLKPDFILLPQPAATMRDFDDNRIFYKTLLAQHGELLQTFHGGGREWYLYSIH